MFEDVAVAGIPIDQLFAQFMGGVAAAHEEPPAGEGAAVPAPAGMIQNLEEVCLDKGTVEVGPAPPLPADIHMIGTHK